MVSRSEVDMLDIRQEYVRNYGKSLYTAISVSVLVSRFIVSTISRMGFIRKNDRGNCSIKFSHSLFHRAIRPETIRNSSWSSVGAVTENNRVITGMLCSINSRFPLHLMHYTQATRLHATPVLLLHRLPDVWMQSVLFAGFARWISIAKML